MIVDGIGLLAAVAVIAFVAGLIHSGIGFGFGIVAISLLPFVIDTRQAHVVVSTASVPVLLMATWAYREGADWPSLGRALLGAAIFLPLGLWAFEWVSIDRLVRATGLAILVMVLLSFRNRRLAESNADRGGSAFWAGGIAGFLAGAVSIAGPPVAAFALQQRWDQPRFKAFVNQFLLAVSVYKVAGLWYRGFLDVEVGKQVLALTPLAMVGIQVGAVISRRLPTGPFQRLVAGALIAIAVWFLVRGGG